MFFRVSYSFGLCFFLFFFTGQGLSHDIQHIPPSLMVDGARPWLPSNTCARLAHCPRWPPCHHRLWVSSGLPVHRGVEFSRADLAGRMYRNTHTHMLIFNLLLTRVPNNKQALIISSYSAYSNSTGNTVISVQQLFGFVYACYVSKVFQDDEDSCECFCLLLIACPSSSTALLMLWDLPVS